MCTATEAYLEIIRINRLETFLGIAQSEVYFINLFTHKPFMVTCILIQIVKGER